MHTSIASMHNLSQILFCMPVIAGVQARSVPEYHFIMCLVAAVATTACMRHGGWSVVGEENNLSRGKGDI